MAIVTAELTSSVVGYRTSLLHIVGEDKSVHHSGAPAMRRWRMHARFHVSSEGMHVCIL
jgi:hypothetical protein